MFFCKFFFESCSLAHHTVSYSPCPTVQRHCLLFCYIPDEESKYYFNFDIELFWLDAETVQFICFLWSLMSSVPKYIHKLYVK